ALLEPNTAPGSLEARHGYFNPVPARWNCRDTKGALGIRPHLVYASTRLFENSNRRASNDGARGVEHYTGRGGRAILRVLIMVDPHLDVPRGPASDQTLHQVVLAAKASIRAGASHGRGLPIPRWIGPERSAPRVDDERTCQQIHEAAPGLDASIGP